MLLNVITNWFYFLAGIVFLGLSKGRFLLFGYSPKFLSISEFERCVEYDIMVVDRWMSHMRQYIGKDESEILHNHRVLELGPGSDLGVGLYILSKSAKEYHAVDVYNLIQSVPDDFYTFFFSYLREKKGANILTLQNELDKTKRGTSERLNYHWRKDFDIVSALGQNKVDTIFSNAAFEHFDDIHETIKALSKVSRHGTIMIASVDLKTHSRWIRDKDPNNIYRYPNWLFSLLSFRATPNRVRPYQYKQALEKNGWTNVLIEADTTLEESQCNSTIKYLDKQFVGDQNQMHYTSIWIFATKS